MTSPSAFSLVYTFEGSDQELMCAHKSVGPLVVYVIEGKCLLSMSRNFLSRDPSADDCAWLPAAGKPDVQLM